jgi:hypothetical protein
MFRGFVRKNLFEKRIVKPKQMCYHNKEVNTMEENRTDMQPQLEQEQAPKEQYVPRPMWQVWAARIGLVIFIVGLILYYINLLRGGV